MTDCPTIRRSRTEAFEHTISGLLTKRGDLADEAAKLRSRLAEIKVDLAALDRTLALIGYRGNVEAAMPGVRRASWAGSGRMSRRVADVLRAADRPMTTAEVTAAVLAVMSADGLAEGHPKRVPKALGRMAETGRVTQAKDDAGRVVWRKAPHAASIV